MRIYLLPLALILTSALAAEPSSAKPPARPPTLEDVIFDPHYLRQALGPKTIISPIGPSAPPPELSPEVTAAIENAGLKKVTQLLALPAGATPLQRDKTVAPRFPDEKRRSGSPGTILFLIYVGTDGKVQGLYCSQASDHAYAVAAAEALLVWRFKPAKLGGTALPVLASQRFEFDFK